MDKTILSTKTLPAPLQERVLNAGYGLVHYDLLQIKQINADFTLDSNHVIITSKNAIPALEKADQNRNDITVFCVGSVTAGLLTDKGFSIAHQAENADELADYILENHREASFTFLTSAQRRDELPCKLTRENITFTELHVYDSHPRFRRFERTFAAVLFYSAGGVYAFAKANPQQTTAICIGGTTAVAAGEFYDNVKIASRTTVENTVVTAIKTMRNEK